MAIRRLSKPRPKHRPLRAALTSLKMIAFAPAITLGAYWYAGEGGLLFSALAFPALLWASVWLKHARVQQGAGETRLSPRATTIALLDETINAAPSGDRGCACLTLEIDGFPGLRARVGHQSADRVVSETTRRLQDALRDHDQVVGLQPGRFAIIVSAKSRRIDLEVLIQLSARLQAAVSEPVSVDASHVLVTSCVGFSLPSRVPQQTGQAYLTSAEAALADAQHSGPGSVRAFSEGMQVPAIIQAHSTAEVVAVTEALENNQITPWFQPQVSTDTGDLTGFEALARWEIPGQPPILPNGFLPSLADAGLTERLCEVILFHSLTALREWDRAGLDVPSVAVNFSAADLRDPGLVDKIRWDMDRFELAPERLTIEILENVVALSDEDIITRNVAALARLGCRTELDDFGTGHASIGNIRRFDIGRIKIDRSFITRVDSDRDQQNMVAAILTMAEHLNVDTLAEGVETVGEHAMLAQLGCRHVQGFSIGRPMPLAQTQAWIEAHRARIQNVPSVPRRAG